MIFEDEEQMMSKDKYPGIFFASNGGHLADSVSPRMTLSLTLSRHDHVINLNQKNRKKFSGEL